MTKGGSLPLGAGGHHRADFHLRLVDDDTLNEPCHPLSALGKRRDMHVLLRVGIELPQLLR